MNAKRVEIVVPLAIFILAVINFFAGIPLAVYPGEQVYGVGPKFFPNLITIIIGVLAAALLVQKLKKGVKDELVWSNEELKNVSLLSLGAFIYIFAIGYLGYYISTFLAMFIFIYALGYKKWKTILVIILVTEVLVYLLFEKGLFIFIPRGFLF